MTTINFTYYGGESGITQVSVEFTTESGEYTRFPKNPELNTDRHYPRTNKKALFLLRDAINDQISLIGEE